MIVWKRYERNPDSPPPLDLQSPGCRWVQQRSSDFRMSLHGDPRYPGLLRELTLAQQCTRG